MAHDTDIPVGIILQAARRAEVIAAMSSFYAEADRRIAERGATCWNKGECCRFGEFGHRLYVTTLEIAYHLAIAGPPPPGSADTCPYAHHGRCHARQTRPLGCRVFFCDPAAKDWQGPLTEELLTRLRTMHESLGVHYIYADWIALLRALVAAVAGTPGPLE